LLAFASIVLVTNPKKKISSFLSIGAIATSFVISIVVLTEVIANPVPKEFYISWLNISGFKIDFGMLIDPLTSIMLMVVTTVSMLVQIYSVGYMAGDPRFSRYFAFLS
jgi:NADH-quinone oxidoreductase subunit L